MRAIGWFTLRFLLFSLCLGILWWHLVEWYNGLVIGGLNGFFAVTGYPWNAVAGGQYAAQIDHFRLFHTQKTNIIALIDGRSLHFNIIALTSLFLATPRVLLGKKLRNLAIALGLTYCTHLIHVLANCYRAVPHIFLKQTYSLSQWLTEVAKIIFAKGVEVFAIFMEQVGSMLVPFMLWLLFYYGLLRVLFPKREQ